MSTPFVAEIRLLPFTFAPKGWAFCTGQLMPISQNTALFSLLGTNYGGDGKSTFGLPNLQGAVAMHTTQYGGQSAGGTYYLGQTGGESSVVLLTSEMPSHTHTVSADVIAPDTTLYTPAAGVPGNTTPNLNYTDQPATSMMSIQMVAPAGGNAGHNNMQPTLTLNYCIALQGVYPPRP